jgi:hypothetical protein
VAGSPAWLTEINRYREASGESLVVEEPAWLAGIQNHLTYLEATPAEYFTGPYTSLHTENPASPYYTESGAIEAGDSNLVEGGGHSEVAAIDAWWTAPFHAIGMLRPQLTRAEFGYHATSGDAGLDVIQGLDFSIPKPATPVLFPGPGVTTNLAEFNGGELPSPLETCGWQSLGAVGLPIVALLPNAPDPSLTASVSGAGGRTESSANGEVCVVDEHDYYSADPVYGEDGRGILAGENAVLVIPRHPLANGSYEVAIQQVGQEDIDWSFSVDRPNVPPTGATGGSVEPQVRASSEVRSSRSFAEPSPGDLVLYLTLRRGRASVHVPSWVPFGLAFKSYVYKQLRFCRRRHCHWSTVASATRLRHTTGSTTSFSLPYRPARGRRVGVAVTLSSFSINNWSYSATKAQRIED